MSSKYWWTRPFQPPQSSSEWGSIRLLKITRTTTFTYLMNNSTSAHAAMRHSWVCLKRTCWVCTRSCVNTWGSKGAMTKTKEQKLLKLQLKAASAVSRKDAVKVLKKLKKLEAWSSLCRSGPDSWRGQMFLLLMQFIMHCLDAKKYWDLLY